VLTVPDHAEAVALVKRHHYSRSAPNTSTYRHGLYRFDGGLFRGDLYGVTIWLPPTRVAAESVAGKDWQGVLTLSRLVVLPEVPTNGASFLLGRSMQAIDRKKWPVLVTYADTAQGHTGAIYKATNWQEVGPVPAGDTWIGPDGEQRGRKRGAFSYTAQQMRDMGFVRQSSLPKIKFVHRVAA
jgi:hypothetical protein